MSVPVWRSDVDPDSFRAPTCACVLMAIRRRKPALLLAVAKPFFGLGDVAARKVVPLCRHVASAAYTICWSLAGLLEVGVRVIARIQLR